MQITAPEVLVIFHTLRRIQISRAEREIKKEVESLIVPLTESAGQNSFKFKDGEIELKTLHKAFLLGKIESLQWPDEQWDVIDKLEEKLN